MIRWVLAGAYVALILLFSAQPESSAGHMSRTFLFLFPNLSPAQIVDVVFYLRKGGHVAAYFVGTLLILFAVHGTPLLRRRPYLAALILSFGVAALDEWYQTTLPHRSGTVDDVLIDGIGIISALLAAYAVSRHVDSRAAKEDMEYVENESG